MQLPCTDQRRKIHLDKLKSISRYLLTGLLCLVGLAGFPIFRHLACTDNVEYRGREDLAMSAAESA
jgi:hypothetical protein